MKPDDAGAGAAMQSLLEWGEQVDRRWRALRDWWGDQGEAWAGVVAPPAEVGRLASTLGRVLDLKVLGVNDWLVREAERSPYWDRRDVDQRLRGLLQNAWARLRPPACPPGGSGPAASEGLLLYDFELLFALRLHGAREVPGAAPPPRCLWLVPGWATGEEIWYHRGSHYSGQCLPVDWLSPAACWVLPGAGDSPGPLS